MIFIKFFQSIKNGGFNEMQWIKQCRTRLSMMRLASDMLRVPYINKTREHSIVSM